MNFLVLSKIGPDISHKGNAKKHRANTGHPVHNGVAQIRNQNQNGQADEQNRGADFTDGQRAVQRLPTVQGENHGEELEEFLAVEDEDLLEKLIEVVQADFEADEAFDDE
jgi:hypothetical protein